MAKTKSSERDWMLTIAKAVFPPSVQRWVRKHRFDQALRRSDTFIIGHPKSGNTWLAYMLAIALFRDRDHAVTLENVGDYVPFIHEDDYRIADYAHLPAPRVFRNEFPTYRPLYPRIVYLLRDPRAVLVSFWHMYQVMFDHAEISLHSFVDQYLEAKGIFTWWNRGLARWDRQVSDFVAQAENDPSVLVLKYEDMVLDRRTSLEKALELLAVSRDPEDLDRAEERGDFDRMRRVERRHGAEAYKGKAVGTGRFIRVGKIDGWRAEMDDDLAGRIEQEFAPAMRLAGYLPDPPRGS